MRIHVTSTIVFFLMIRRPPRSTLDRSSAASDVYKRQGIKKRRVSERINYALKLLLKELKKKNYFQYPDTSVSYTHLRAHETVLDLVCRLLLEKKHTTLFTSY